MEARPSLGWFEETDQGKRRRRVGKGTFDKDRWMTLPRYLSAAEHGDVWHHECSRGSFDTPLRSDNAPLLWFRRGETDYTKTLREEAFGEVPRRCNAYSEEGLSRGSTTEGSPCARLLASLSFGSSLQASWHCREALSYQRRLAHSLERRRGSEDSTSSNPRSGTPAKKPFKILDTPDLEEDWNLEALDCSKDERLVVSTRAGVYLYDARRQSVIALTLREDNHGDYDGARTAGARSVKWSRGGTLLSTLTSEGVVELWDAETRAVSFEVDLGSVDVNGGETNLVAMPSEWCEDDRCFLAGVGGGTRASRVVSIDVRAPPGLAKRLWRRSFGRGGVGCIKWREEDFNLVACGTDGGGVYLWDKRKAEEPVELLRSGSSSSRASSLSWCPWNNDVLIVGSSDELCFWNVRTNSCENVFGTGSNVTSLVCSASNNEVITSQARPGEGRRRVDESGNTVHQPHSTFAGLSLWCCGGDGDESDGRSNGGQPYGSTVTKRSVVLRRDVSCGHVLRLAASPNRQTVYALQADETLCFWKLFSSSSSPSSRSKRRGNNDGSRGDVTHEIEYSEDRPKPSKWHPSPLKSYAKLGIR